MQSTVLTVLRGACGSCGCSVGQDTEHAVYLTGGVELIGSQLFGLFNPRLNLGDSGGVMRYFLRVVNFFQFGLQIGSHAMLQLFTRVDAAFFQQIRHFTPNPIQAHQVGAIHPACYLTHGNIQLFR